MWYCKATYNNQNQENEKKLLLEILQKERIINLSSS